MNDIRNEIPSLFPDGVPSLTDEQFRAALGVRACFQRSRVCVTGQEPTEAERQRDWEGAVYGVLLSPEDRDRFNA